MGCEIVPTEHGNMIVCRRGGGVDRSSCDFCERPHAFLCDHLEDEWGRTCDAKLCAKCKTQDAETFRDYCPNHVPVTVQDGD